MPSNKLKTWTTNSSKYLVNDRWLRLRADSCTTLDGHVIEPFYVFEYTDWVNCLVLDKKLDVIMVEHYRHGVDKYLLELVGGVIEPADASPEAAMQRELAEELGYAGGSMYQTGVSYPNPANQTNKVYSFITFGGSCVQKQKLEAGETLRVTKQSFQSFIHTFANGNADSIPQSLHLAAIFFACTFIKGSDEPGLEMCKKVLADSW